VRSMAKAKKKSKSSSNAVKTTATGSEKQLSIPAAAPETSMTSPERVASVMGDKIMSVGEVEAALAKARVKFKSKNLRAYLYTLLHSSLKTATDPRTGEALTDPRSGDVVRVHVFTGVKHGHYRVATPEDIEQEIGPRRSTASGKKPPKAAREIPADQVSREQEITPAAEANPNKSRTVPERIAAVMGARAMSAPELLVALDEAGEKFESSNLPSYMSTTLNSTLTSVVDASGETVRLRSGKLLKVHVFTLVKRGVYRVSTPEDMQLEAQTLLAKDGGRAGTALAVPRVRTQVTAATPSKAAPKIAKPQASITSSTAGTPPSLGGSSDLPSMVRDFLREELRAVVSAQLPGIVKEEMEAIFSMLKARPV